MATPLPPRLVGSITEVDTVQIRGALFPWADPEPVFLVMPSCDDLFLPLFTKEAQLRSVLARVGVSFTSIKHVDDPDVFLATLPLVVSDKPLRMLRIILNPHFTPEGTVRFTELRRQGQDV